MLNMQHQDLDFLSDPLQRPHRTKQIFVVYGGLTRYGIRQNIINDRARLTTGATITFLRLRALKPPPP